MLAPADRTTGTRYASPFVLNLLENKSDANGIRKQDYAREYIRLSLLGVNNINQLTECTKVLPPATKGFRAVDQYKLDKWLNSVGNKGAAKKVAQDIEKGAPASVDVPPVNNAN